jgi:hypothetical protein
MDQLLLLDGPYIKDGFVQVTDARAGRGIESRRGEGSSGCWRELVGLASRPNTEQPCAARVANEICRVGWTLEGIYLPTISLRCSAQASVTDCLPLLSSPSVAAQAQTISPVFEVNLNAASETRYVPAAFSVAAIS